MKGIRSDLVPIWINKHTDLLVKFGVSFLLVGLAFRSLVSDPIRFPSSALQTPSTPPVKSRIDSRSPPPLPVLLNPPVDDHDADSDAIVTILSNLTTIPGNGTQASGFGGRCYRIRTFPFTLTLLTSQGMQQEDKKTSLSLLIDGTHNMTVFHPQFHVLPLSFIPF